MKKLFSICFCITLFAGLSLAQKPVCTFGEEVSKNKAKGKKIEWIQVNTNDDTWVVKGDELICSGNPVGVIRTSESYENFILHIEWKHTKAGGNSGVFVWSKAEPAKNRLPDGIEAQMLEPEWVNINTKEGKVPPLVRVHGELFGMGGVKVTPDNLDGFRSVPLENRCKPKGEWNTYDLVCVDGTIKLSVNGKFVNGVSHATQKNGYICLESEGSEIIFRNLQVTKLP